MGLVPAEVPDGLGRVVTGDLAVAGALFEGTVCLVVVVGVRDVAVVFGAGAIVLAAAVVDALEVVDADPEFGRLLADPLARTGLWTFAEGPCLGAVGVDTGFVPIDLGLVVADGAPAAAFFMGEAPTLVVVGFVRGFLATKSFGFS